eukprot:gene4526-5642_t
MSSSTTTSSSIHNNDNNNEDTINSSSSSSRIEEIEEEFENSINNSNNNINLSKQQQNNESSSSSSNSTNKVNSAFECNICFDDVSEPVVTQCGHLFCWSCIFQWLQHNSSQQCPVCKASVSEEKLIPIYGRGGSNTDPRKKNSIPQRPPGRPEQPRPGHPGNSNRDFFGSNQFHNGFGGISFSAGFGLFPGLFGVHFYNQSHNASGGGGTTNQHGFNNGEFESIFLSRIFFAIGLLVLFFILFS